MRKKKVAFKPVCKASVIEHYGLASRAVVGPHYVSPDPQRRAPSQ